MKYLLPLNKLDTAAKKHDFAYNNPNISTVEADEQFYKDTAGTGILRIAARTAIRTKHSLGLDSTFRGTPTDVGINNFPLLDSDKIMADVMKSPEENSGGGGGGNGWKRRNIGGYLPVSSGNHMQTYMFRRSSKNIVKTTDMNKVQGHFVKYKGTENGIQNIGHYAWVEPESADYLVPSYRHG